MIFNRADSPMIARVLHCVLSAGVAADRGQQRGVGLRVGGGDQAALARVQRLPVDAGDDAAGRPAQREAGGEMHAVAQVTCAKDSTSG